MLGDDIEKITKLTGVKSLVNKASKMTGKPCGCAARKEKYNNPALKINKILYKK